MRRAVWRSRSLRRRARRTSQTTPSGDGSSEHGASSDTDVERRELVANQS